MEERVQKSSWKDYFTLFGLFFKMGAVTFGGGYAMLPILERELVDNRDWVTKDELLDYYAIGQSTPGIIAVNVATFVGYNRRGVSGAIAATAGIVSPSLIIIMILATFISNFAEITWVQKALKGINVVVGALLVQSVISMGKKAITNILGAVMAVAAFVAIAVLDIKTVWIVLLAAAIGILVYGRKGKGEKAK